jgi:hypothetical protein
MGLLWILIGCIVAYSIKIGFFDKGIISVKMAARMLAEEELVLKKRQKDFENAGHVRAELTSGHLTIDYRLTGFETLVTESIIISSEHATGQIGVTFINELIYAFSLSHPRIIWSRESPELDEYRADLLQILQRVKNAAGLP